MGDRHTEHHEHQPPRPPIQIIPPAESVCRPATIHTITMSQSGDKPIRHPTTGHILSQAALSPHQTEVLKAFTNSQAANITRMQTRPMTINPVGHMAVTGSSGASSIMPVQREVIRHSSDVSHAAKSVVIAGNTSQGIQIHTATSLPKQRQTLFQITSTSPAVAGTMSMPTMSSVIRGTAPVIQSQSAPFPSHLPRGAIAAASALSIPKAGAANTAVLRPSQSIGAVQLTSTAHTQSPLQTTLNSTKTAVQASHSALQCSLSMNQLSHGAHIHGSSPSASILTIPKPGPLVPGSAVLRPSSIHTPINTTTAMPSSVKIETNRAQLISTLKTSAPARSNSPALTLASLSQTDVQRQTVPLHQPVSSSSNPSLQITLTPKSTASEIKGNMQTKIHTASSMATPQQKVLLSSQTQGAPFVQQASLAAMVKSVGMNLTTHSQPTNLTALNMTVPPKTTAPNASDIPVAKVPPQRHHCHQQPAALHPQITTVVTSSGDASRSDPPIPHTTQSSHPPLPSNLIVTQANHASSSIVITTSNTSSASQPSQDSRSSMPPYIAPQELYYHSLQYGSLNPLVYQQVVGAAQSRLPGLVTGQSSNLAASLAAAQTIAVSPSQPVRFNHPLMVTVDPSRPLNMHGGQYPHSGTSTPDSIRSASSSATDSATSLNTVTPISTTATAHAHAHNLATSPQHGTNLTSTPISNPSASPRPSILRKRTADTPVIIKKPFNLSASEALSPHKETSSTPHSNLSSPKTPAGDNSQSSTDTALSAEANTPTPTHNNATDMRIIKQEPPDLLENGIPTTPTHSVEASPRKKPRKQLLHANEDLKDNSSSDEELNKLTDFKQERLKSIKREIRDEYVDDDGVRWTLEKNRPSVTFLMNFYNINWKSRNNHYVKHTDIKLKDERRPTVNELSNQKGVVQKASGWKLYHLGAQLEDLVDLEKELCDKISEVQESIDPKPPTKHVVGDDEIGMVHELTQGNVQRCHLITDQLNDAKSSMLKVLDHKQRIMEIVQKHMSKRPIKKKERT